MKGLLMYCPLKTELLSPAKDKQTAIEAINCGADAVYMGASCFGARRNAPNSLEDIKEVVNYAHKFWVKVFITVNTILNDKELDEAVKLVKRLDEIGVDAVIVQDMGLLNKLMELQNAPQKNGRNSLNLAIHMSTQCDNRDVEKVSFFNKLGVSRVVLARELSLDKIREIHNANPNLELEAFVHGALCVSYSGQCYLSQFIGGRSANRGECAQPCRKKYTVKTIEGKILAKDIHALCLKDFNASIHLKEMVDAGVFSFKIEGRLKETNYVKNVTAYYRQELDKCSEKISSGKCIYPFVPNPEKSFNRGFTDYFLEKRKDCFNFVSPKSKGEYLGEVVEVKKDCFVIKTDKEVHAQDGLVVKSEGCLVNKVILKGKAPTPTLSQGEGVLLVIYPNKKIKLKVGDKVYRNLDVEFEKLLSQPVKRQICVRVVVIPSPGERARERVLLTLTDENNISISLPLEGEHSNNPEKMKETFVKQFSKTGESDFYIEDIKIATELPFLPVGAINQLRRQAFEQLMTERLKQYKREIQKPLSYVPYYKKQVDYRANVFNKEAKEFYSKCGCNVLEPALEEKLPEHPIELMRTKHCIKYALNMCKSPQKLILEDEHGKTYPLIFDCKNCEMVVMNK